MEEYYEESTCLRRDSRPRLLISFTIFVVTANILFDYCYMSELHASYKRKLRSELTHLKTVTSTHYDCTRRIVWIEYGNDSCISPFNNPFETNNSQTFYCWKHLNENCRKKPVNVVKYGNQCRERSIGLWRNYVLGQFFGFNFLLFLGVSMLHLTILFIQQEICHKSRSQRF